MKTQIVRIEANGPRRSPFVTPLALSAILLVAAALRLWALCERPPGLHQDEAANAWNAWCLLKTGHDQANISWPIFTIRCLGGYSCTLYIYYLIPFLALGGLNVWTIRLSAAVAGIAAVILAYYVGARMFNRPVGLVAAGVMALTPWAIEQSRWGHEASMVPALVLGTLALMLWARLPITEQSGDKPRPVPALLAGVFAGVSCYGYQTVRVFLPLLFAGLVLVNWRGWWVVLKTRRGFLAVAVFCLGLSATFGPLVWKHFTDPAVGQRGRTTLAWEQSDPPLTKLWKAAERYPDHFGADFLFVRGDVYRPNHMPGWGQLQWYMLPMMLLGLAFVIAGFRRNPSARTLAVWLLAYPIGDSLTRHVSLHALRSLPGLPAMIILSAIGTVLGLEWLWRRNKLAAKVAGCALGVAVAVQTVAYGYDYFVQPRDRLSQIMFHDDYVRACRWLKPRFGRIDAVVNTTMGINQPYIISLVMLDYPPRQWFADPKVILTPGEWDICLRYGKMYFAYDPRRLPSLEELYRQGKRRLVFILRPEEAQSGFDFGRLVQVIRNNYGEATLLIFERILQPSSTEGRQ